jgi:hypothetical protein
MRKSDLAGGYGLLPYVQMFRIAFSIFGIAPLMASRSYRNRSQAEAIASRCVEKTRSKSLDLTDHLPPRLSTMNSL